MGRTSTEDEPHSGSLAEATMQEMIKKISKVVLEDHRIKTRETTEAVGISFELVHNILHEHLGMKKLCVRWMPQFLTLQQK